MAREFLALLVNSCLTAYHPDCQAAIMQCSQIIVLKIQHGCVEPLKERKQRNVHLQQATPGGGRQPSLLGKLLAHFALRVLLAELDG